MIRFIPWRPRVYLIFLFVWAAVNPTPVFGSVFYIDFSRGADNNTGTDKNTPWKHAPGMTDCSDLCKAVVLQPGDSVIFKGGVTWDHTCFPFTIRTPGLNDSRRIYYGVDQTWFSGSTWTRPIFDEEDNIPTGYSMVVFGPTAAWLTLDNIEIKNFRIENSSDPLGRSMIQFQYGATNITVTNSLIHSWTATVGGCDSGCDDQTGAVTGLGPMTNTVLDHVTIYNDKGNKNIGACSFNVAVVQYSTLHDCTQGTFGGVIVHDCQIYNIRQSGDASAHENALQTSSGRAQIYNNVVHDVFHGTCVYPVLGPDSGTVNVFNNVVWNCVPTPFGPDSERIGSATVDVNIYNNTAKGGSVFSAGPRAGNNPIRVLTIRNNHWISDLSNPLYVVNGAAMTITQSNNIVMTTAVATRQGYTVENRFAPTNITNSTVDTGSSEAARLFSTDIGGVTRPQCKGWDVGAYEFRDCIPIVPTGGNVHLLNIDSTPPGLQFSLEDGTLLTSPNTVWLSEGDHSITWVSPQAKGSDTQYVFQSWADSDAGSTRPINITADASYSANFQTQYLFNSVASPPYGGMVGPPTGFYNAGQTLSLFVAPNANATFTGWTGNGPGSYTGANLNATITINAPITETANFLASAPLGLRFVPVPPCRIADTRNPDSPLGGPTLAGSISREFNIPSSGCGIPVSAASYSLNVTVVPRVPLSYLTLWPAGVRQPFVATLNSEDGRTKANAAIVAAGTSGSVSVYATNATDLVLDINGYFESTNPDGLVFYPLTPCRIADTRNPYGKFGGPMMSSKETRTFPILSSACNIPATARAYALNITVAPSTGLTYLTAWPTGSSLPLVSTLNSPSGSTVANAAIVPAGTGGSINIFATDQTHLIIDINGYFGPPGPGGLSFYPVTPCRMVDTRNTPVGLFTAPSLLPQKSRSFPLLASACTPPPSALAYSLNVTAVPQAPLSYLTLYPAGEPRPLASLLNAEKAVHRPMRRLSRPAVAGLSAFS